MKKVPLTALAAALLSACIGSDERGATDADAQDADPTYGALCGGDIYLSAAIDDGDGVLANLLAVPKVRERHAPIRVGVAWNPWRGSWELEQLVVELEGGDEVTTAAADLEVTESYGKHLTRIRMDDDLRTPVAVRARFVSGDDSCEPRVDIAPPRAGVGARVTAAAVGGDGTLWTGTVMNGLFGHTPDGGRVHYRGVYSVDAYDRDWAGPQSQLIMALTRQGERGLWLGTATTGISWFDPGPSALETGDDTWIHHQPPAPEALSLKELRETVTALAPDGDTGLYVGTLDGLWYVRHDGDPSDVSWTRLADGAVFAVAPRDDGLVLAGFTAAVTPEALEGSSLLDSWERARAPLLVLDVGGTPDDRDDDVATWLSPGDAASVVSLWSRPDGVLLGTDRGLYAWRPDDSEPPLVSLLAAAGPQLVVTSLDAAGDDVWVAARSACDPEVGLLARVRLDLEAVNPVVAIVPVDLEGLGIPPHVSLVRALDEGALLVSTLVADTSGRDLTPPECVETLVPGDLTVDTWILPGDGGAATPL